VFRKTKIVILICRVANCPGMAGIIPKLACVLDMVEFVPEFCANANAIVHLILQSMNDFYCFFPKTAN